MEEFSKVIVFQLNNQSYGVSVKQVMSIERLVNFTVIPNTSDFIEGVINLRGDITPIVNLSERLNLEKIDYTEQTRILIVRLDNVQVGLIVDSATDVIDIDHTVIEPAGEILHGGNEVFLEGVAKLENSLLLLLNLKNILNTEETYEVKEVANE